MYHLILASRMSFLTWAAKVSTSVESIGRIDANELGLVPRGPGATGDVDNPLTDIHKTNIFQLRLVQLGFR